MKTLLAATLVALATQVHAQALEADLDGNASALQASELRPELKKETKPLLRSAPRSAGRVKSGRA